MTTSDISKSHRLTAPAGTRIVIGAVVLLLCAVWPWTAAVASVWEEVRTAHFRIQYTGDESSARRVGRIAEETLERTSRRLRIGEDVSVDVWLAASEDDLRALSKVPIRDWAQGYAFPREHEIVLLRPTGSERWRELERITRHEVAHICLGYVVGEHVTEIPSWFHEGFAMYASETWTLRDQWTLLGGVLFHWVVPLSDLSGRFSADRSAARIAYAQSFSAVRSLATDYSFSQLRTLLDRLADGEEFDAAFRTTFGLTVAMFDAEWRERASGGMEWAALVGGGLALGAFFAPFLVLGYWRRSRSRRRRLDAWEAEEAKPDRFFR